MQLLHGDCLDLLPTIPDASVDIVVTDPPYIIGASSAGNLASKSGTWADMMNSSHWFQAWYSEVWRVLKEDGAFWSFCNWRTLPVVMRAAAQARIPITSVMVWDKVWIGPGGPQGLRPRYELITLHAKPGFRIPNRGVPDIWVSKWTGHKPSGHPAEKPVALIRDILTTSAVLPGAVVLDPFTGSGSTGEAAKLEGLGFIGIEQDPSWLALAEGRLDLRATLSL